MVASVGFAVMKQCDFADCPRIDGKHQRGQWNFEDGVLTVMTTNSLSPFISTPVMWNRESFSFSGWRNTKSFRMQYGRPGLRLRQTSLPSVRINSRILRRGVTAIARSRLALRLRALVSTAELNITFSSEPTILDLIPNIAQYCGGDAT